MMIGFAFTPLLKASGILQLGLILCLFSTNDTSAQEIDRSVVKIFVTRQEYDFTQPWQRSSPAKSSGSGCIIDSNRILTCAHVIEFGEFIEVRKGKDSRKYTARVEFIAPEYDLAILRVADERFFTKTKPLSLAGLPDIGERVNAYGFPTGGDELSITSGIVSRIENIEYSYSDFTNLGIQIDAAINPGNSGGPVLLDGKLAGIAFQGRSNAQSIGYMIPTTVINAFLRDIDNDSTYDGPVPIYTQWQKLENPSLRQCYRMADTMSGVLINFIHTGSALYGSLLPNDVLLSIDSITLADDGSMITPEGLKTSFETALQSRSKNDTVLLQVLRNGTIQEIATPLFFKRRNIRLIDKIDLQPRYYMEQGFVFTTPSYYYFRNDGYWAYKNPELSYYYYDKVLNADTATEIVLLSSVLPDESNAGYHDVRNRIIKKANGQPVESLTQLAVLFSATKDDEIVLEDAQHNKYVIPLQGLQDKNEAIMRRYGVPQKMRL